MTKRKLKNALYTTLIMIAFMGLVKLIGWMTINHFDVLWYVAVGIILGTLWIIIYGMVSATNED